MALNTQKVVLNTLIYLLRNHLYHKLGNLIFLLCHYAVIFIHRFITFRSLITIK